jgi:hypothetical protein
MKSSKSLGKMTMKVVATAALALALPGLALAQQAKPAPAPAAPAAAGAPKPVPSDDNVTYKAKTVYDFEDDNVEGDLQRPDGELIQSGNKAKHSSLIEIRKDFIPEMLKSLEDV